MRPRVTHVHECPVCGERVQQNGRAANYRKLVSCGSPRCTAALLAKNARSRGLVGPGRPQAWDAARLAGHATSPKTAPAPSHACAKSWSLMDGAGEVWTFQNLAHFIREHPDFFDPDDLSGSPSRAFSGLAKLHPERRDARKSWKGWTWAE